MQTRHKIYTTYIAYLILAVVITHVVFSGLAAYLTRKLYHDVILNVRNVEKTQFQRDAGLSYLAASTHKKPSVLIIGSSFSYGYSLLSRNIYSQYLKQYLPSYSITNASVVGDHGAAAMQQLRFMQNLHLKTNILVLEINLANFTGVQNAYPPEQALGIENKIEALLPSYLGLYLFHPLGLNVFKVLELNRKYMVGEKIAYDYSFDPLAADYFKDLTYFQKHYPSYAAFLTDFLISAKQVSDQVYFFISPIYGEGVKGTQFKLSDLQQEIAAIDQVCQKSGPNVHCLNPGFRFSKKDFMNLTHFNAQGHEDFARWLAGCIKTPGAKECH